MAGQTNNMHRSIAHMNAFKNKSFEELRWEDYQAGNKGNYIYKSKIYYLPFD